MKINSQPPGTTKLPFRRLNSLLGPARCAHGLRQDVKTLGTRVYVRAACRRGVYRCPGLMLVTPIVNNWAATRYPLAGGAPIVAKFIAMSERNSPAKLQLGCRSHPGAQAQRDRLGTAQATPGRAGGSAALRTFDLSEHHLLRRPSPLGPPLQELATSGVGQMPTNHRLLTGSFFWKPGRSGQVAPRLKKSGGGCRCSGTRRVRHSN
jgi:hypothetical protein